MEKGFVLKQLEKNDQEHQKIFDKIDNLKDQINQNHIELLNSINEGKIDINTLKIKMGSIALIMGALPSLVELIIKKWG